MSRKARGAHWVVFGLFLVTAFGAYAAGQAHFPAPFNHFSHSDILSQMFTGYDRASGRESEFPNQEGKPDTIYFKNVYIKELPD